MTEILEIGGLQTHFCTEVRVVRALSGVNFSVEHGEAVGLVGEAGNGKSVTAKSVMQSISSSPEEIVDGSIRFRGENVLEKFPSEVRAIRDSDTAMVFQGLSTSLNPAYVVRNRMIEVIATNRGVSKPEAEDIAHETLEEVEMSRPKGVLKSYPHRLSGGMKQRVMIAMELACDPELIIADEPTTALGMTIEKEVLSIFGRLVGEHNFSVLWITHNLGIVAQFCDRVGVMYTGETVELGTVRDIFHRPAHPYTRELLKTIPNVANPKGSLGAIGGSAPNLVNPPSGYRFRPRCPDAEERCHSENPPKIRGADQYEPSCLVHEVADTDHSPSKGNSGDE